MSSDALRDGMLEETDPAADAAARLGVLIRTERRRQDLTLAALGTAAGVSTTTVHAVEAGQQASLRTYARLATGLQRSLGFALLDHDADDRGASRAVVQVGRDGSFDERLAGGRDIVHAAMGELEAAHLLARGFKVAVDLPWQHYRFGGRADIVAWDVRRRALLHIENKTQLPDVQDAIGRFAEKRAFLGCATWEGCGFAGPPLVETHVMVALWSSEVIDVVRRSPAMFRATFPAPPDAFDTWWTGEVPATTTAAFVVLDPFATGRTTRFASLRDVLADTRHRLAGYADAADLVRQDRSRRR